MKRLFLGLFVVSTILNADYDDKTCLNDMQNMSEYYYNGIKSTYEKEYAKAISDNERSIGYAYKVMQSCTNNPLYDETEIFDYIISSEININNLREKLY